MRSTLDAYLGIHPQALSLEAQRNELLAANLANVDTPNYKARDIDFQAALAAASGSAAKPGSANLSPAPAAALSLTPPSPAVGPAVNAGTAGAAVVAPEAATLGTASYLKYRVPMAPALDGNTVDEQLEQSAFAENSVRYQATLTFLNSALRDLMTAITGS